MLKPVLCVDDMTVSFDGEAVLDRFSLKVGDTETVALLGPSGCGKTTVLRAVAGLQPMDSGTVTLDGQNMATTPTHRRGLGLMFQDHALFPHLRVAANVEFGLRMMGMASEMRSARVAEILELVGLSGLEDRTIDALSGGERQRVALARAIAPAPRLLMLDEPLASLDRTLRDHLVLELQGIFAELGMSVLYVTHDQSEAMALADRMIVMNHGRVVQAGTPADIWSHPTNEFVARFLGLTNVIGAVVTEGTATTPWGLVAPIGGPDGTAKLVIRPEAISLSHSHNPSTSGGVSAIVSGRIFAGNHTRLKLTVDDAVPAITLEATVSGTQTPPAIGSPCVIRFDNSGLVRLDD